MVTTFNMHLTRGKKMNIIDVKELNIFGRDGYIEAIIKDDGGDIEQTICTNFTYNEETAKMIDLNNQELFDFILKLDLHWVHVLK